MLEKKKIVHTCLCVYCDNLKCIHGPNGSQFQLVVLSLGKINTINTMYLLAGAIMRLHIKAALNYTVHTGYIRCASLLVQSCI